MLRLHNMNAHDSASTNAQVPLLPDSAEVTKSSSRAHDREAHGGTNAKLNWLRAGVLGANDGIVSVSCLLLGVIAAGVSGREIFLVGIAAIISGAVSMALGEYVSVSAQRDSERHFIAKEQWELKELPEKELQELTEILADYGIEGETAHQAAQQIHAKNPLNAHLRLELGIDPDDLTNPWAAALSSAASFALGAALPFAASLMSGSITVTIVTLATLALTGFLSAVISETSRGRAVARLTIGGALGLLITYGAGVLFGA